ncbi:hypothetical protein ACFFRR_002884 [Megaselia abdita]
MCCCLDSRISIVIIGIFNLTLGVPTFIVLLMTLGYCDQIEDFHYIRTFMTLLSIVANIYLLEGVQFKKPSYLQIWIVFQTLILIILFLSMLFGIMLLIFIFTELFPPIYLKPYNIETVVGFEVMCFLAFALNSYFWMVVKNYQIEVGLTSAVENRPIQFV